MLVRDWAQGRPAAFDITITSPLTPGILAKASVRVGTSAKAAEKRKHKRAIPEKQSQGRTQKNLANPMNINITTPKKLSKKT